MGIADWFKKKPAPDPARSRTFKRSYAAANTGRLFADFIDSERSADSELYPVLNRMRARTRDLARRVSGAFASIGGAVEAR